MIKVLRYQYPHWPGQYDGSRRETELGSFDFSLQEVLSLLQGEARKQEKGLHISSSRRATYDLTLKLTDWVKQHMEACEELVTWHHPSRDTHIEQLQQEHRRWSEAIRKATGSGLQTPISYPEQFEDSFFGGYLQELIYAKQFLVCFCPKCQAEHSPASCRVEEWLEYDCGGQKFICHQGHTLHAHETMEFFPRMS